MPRLVLLFLLSLLHLPLAAQERLWGLETNPYLALTLLQPDNMIWVNGAVSRFSPRRHSELRLPVVYIRDSDGRDTLLGLTWRYYPRLQARAFFPDREAMDMAHWPDRVSWLAGGLRPFFGLTARLFHSTSRYTGAATRFGLGITLGLRWFSSKRLYWGTDITYGRYFLGDTDRYAAVNRYLFPPYDGGTLMADLSFFQWGYRF